MSVHEHRWRGIASVVHHRRHGEHEMTVEVSHRDESSIGEWLASAGPVAAELSPAAVPVAGFWPTPGRREVRPVREFDDDGELATALLAMEREAQALADTLAGENDTRMTLLLGRLRQLDRKVGAMVSAAERAWESTADVLARVLVTRRRKAAITPLVRELGALVHLGDVSPESAAVMVALRSRYLHATDADSQRLPRMSPELLAELDAERGVAA